MNQVVAVVDDDSRVLQSLHNLLESAGHEVHLFTAGRQLLSAPSLRSINCLVTDIAMPEMDGLELSRKVRELRPSLPIILITAHG